MEKIAVAEIALLNDRGIKKFRVNFIKDNKVFGFLKPVKYFE